MFDRRSFLKTACTSAAAVAVSNRFSAFAQPASASGIHAFVTDPKRRHESLPLIGWSSTSKSGDKEEIIVDDSVRHQPLLGFGAAFTDASCFLLSTMPPQTRQKVMNDFFSPAELNLSVGRCCVGASDYSRDVYSYDDVPGDVALEHFSIAHDEAYILPTLRDAAKINRDLVSPCQSVEPARMDEDVRLNAGWVDECEVPRSLCPVPCAVRCGITPRRA